MQLSQHFRSTGGRQQRPTPVLVRASRRGIVAVGVSVKGGPIQAMAAFLCQHGENALRAAILTRRSDGRRVGRHARDIVVAGRVGRRKRRAFRGRRVDHQRKALLGGRQLGDVVVRVGTADVLLHGAVALLLRGIGSARQLYTLCMDVYECVREGCM